MLETLELLMKTGNTVHGFLSVSSAKYHVKCFLELIILPALYTVL